MLNVTHLISNLEIVQNPNIIVQICLLHFHSFKSFLCFKMFKILIIYLLSMWILLAFGYHCIYTNL